MAENETLRELREFLGEIRDLETAAGVLQWDQSTYMPPAGAEARARQLALLGRLAHERICSPRLGELLEGVAHLEQDGSESEAALVRVTRRKRDRAMRLPSELVSELQNHLASSYVAWASAQPEGDFAAVRPTLEKTVELSRRVSDCFPNRDHPADPFVDEVDPGMSVADVRALFGELQQQLVPLVRSIVEQPQPNDDFLRQPFDEETQLQFGRRVIETLGYDFSRGRQDRTHHPFMTRFGAGDVRITTRVRPEELTEALFSTIHEAGHALYEQNIRPEYDGTPLGGGVSAGVHESQSRLWENLVARSRSFWTHFYPELQKTFPKQLAEVPLDDFHRAINKVQRSLIRTDADEVTYNLHVMVRFELETKMLEGELAVADLPDAWNARMRDMLGVEPPSHDVGCLQDVHWFVHTVGGAFQGYTLGNLMSAQFMEAALRDRPDLFDRIAAGDPAPLRNWLTEHVYQHGSVYDPADLVQRATGRPLEVEPFIRYLRSKYGELYNLS
jgi:carboxypeptidase Taq